MTGAVLATVNGAASGGGGGTGHAPNAITWPNPYGYTTASTAARTISGVGSGSAPITATNSGASHLSYVLNGTTYYYTGSFTVQDGDTLAWFLVNLTTSTESGTIVVTSGGTGVGTFTYTVRGNVY